MILRLWQQQFRNTESYVLPPLLLPSIALSAGIISVLLTIWLERHAQRLGLVQAPNHRSSHTKPTARGGGLAVAVTIVAAAIALSPVGSPRLLCIAACIAAIALLGFADDLKDLSARLRFAAQAVILVALLWAAGPLPSPGPDWLAGPILLLLLLLVGLWWINLFNFMDGIDGIAASQAVLVILGAMLVWSLGKPEAISQPTFWLGCSAAAASLGFLLRNWPPARIFMGDSGSNALALTVMALALLSISAGELGYNCWLILPAVFVSDATVTLLRRLSRGERPWQAHRRHAYQQLARRYGHARVTTAYCIITIGWLTPLAAAAEWFPPWQWQLTLTAYLPLVLGAWLCNAGARTETPAGATE